MTTEVRFVLNHDGVAELLRSQGVLAEVTRRAQQIANAAGPDMEVRSEITEHRARASVFTATVAAMVEESAHRTLTRAIDAGRA
jgi:hypothetical protein